LRRGDGPPGAKFYTFAALAVTDALIERRPEVALAAIRAIVATQKALKAEPSLANKVGDELFPGEEAELMPVLIARDAPFYDATITYEALEGLNKFALANGMIEKARRPEQIAAMTFQDAWRAEEDRT
jgi:ABC-type nitrate/sulfonate/bicarbonate transport system substrate-binding protein